MAQKKIRSEITRDISQKFILYYQNLGLIYYVLEGSW